jgi:hypothetical protein
VEDFVETFKNVTLSAAVSASLNNDDKMVYHSFCMDMQQWSEGDNAFFDWLIFGDELTFHISGKVNKHNVRIWGTENPRGTVEHVWDSLKVNAFCAVSCTKVYGPFFFHENTVTGRIYLNIFSEWLLPQLQEDSANFIFIQDGAPPHYHNGGSKLPGSKSASTLDWPFNRPEHGTDMLATKKYRSNAL